MRQRQTPTLFVYLFLLLATVVGLELWVLVGTGIFHAGLIQVVVISGMLVCIMVGTAFIVLRKVWKSNPPTPWGELTSFERFWLVVNASLFTVVAVGLFRVVSRFFLTRFG